MRVLHVIPSIDARGGGPTAALAGLVAGQRAAGMEVSVVATFRAAEETQLADALRLQGADVQLVGPVTGPLRGHSQLVPALQKAMASADVVHIHAVWEEIQYQAVRLARRAGKLCIIRSCGMLTPWSLRQSRWRKRVYFFWRLRSMLRHAAGIHFTTAEERDASYIAKSHARIFVEPNGVDLSEFGELPARGAFRRQHGIAPDRPIIIYLGRLHEGKGLNLLIPAFAAANTSSGSADALLVLAGPDSQGYQAKVQAWIDEHHLQQRVLFTGMLRGQQRVDALVDATLFVLPSYHENFGIAVVEALAAGLPVIITDQVNIHKEIAAAGVGAVIPTEIEPLKNELTRWMQNPELRASSAARARPFVIAHYDWKTIAIRWQQHYAALLHNPPRATPQSPVN